ncbi:MAG: hypothetical protein DDT26_01510 [Dehalococcoidia bacterium]|nr:hypothetical protein [Chloroflexota bacterium]
MLSLIVFNQQFELMCDWYRTEANDEKNELYYQFVQSLTDREFTYACQCAMRVREFFPSPQWLIDQVKPSLKEQALEQWQQLMKTDPNQPRYWEDHGTRHALGIVGGLKFLHTIDEDRLPRLQDKFAEAYALEHQRIDRDRQVYGIDLPTEPARLEPPADLPDWNAKAEWIREKQAEVAELIALLKARKAGKALMPTEALQLDTPSEF